MDPVLEQLKDGVRRFQAEVYPGRAELYRRAASEKQTPHTLFITCSDSRIDPIAITGAAPGELFVTRNIGNMVPEYSGGSEGVSAVVEYAVSGLGVRHIVVCGHTQCGAMQALLNQDAVNGMPAVAEWLKNAQAVEDISVDMLTKENVLIQMQRLKTHPSVADAVAHNKLTISGWVYNIGSGNVEVAEDGIESFTLIS